MKMSGLKDKLYWRCQYANKPPYGPWHCFTRAMKSVDFFESLCRNTKIYRVGGQDIRRPRAELRCAICDRREIERRGWDESGPESKTK